MTGWNSRKQDVAHHDAGYLDCLWVWVRWARLYVLWVPLHSVPDTLSLPSNRVLNTINARYRASIGITLMLVAIGCIAAGVVFLMVADEKMS